MGRKKKAKAKQKGQQLPPHARPPRNPAPVPAPMTHMSLRDEARYMSTHRSKAFDADRKLRYLPVVFVSAGLLQGTIEEKAPSSPEPVQSPLAVDALAKMTIRTPSPSPSSASSSLSGDDIVVFKGRARASGSQTAYHAPSPPAASGRWSPREASPSNACPPTSVLPDQQAPPPADSVPSGPSEQSAAVQGPAGSGHASDPDSDTNSVAQTVFEQRRGGRPIWEGKTTPWVSRSKPGIGWLPVQDRPDMGQFMRGEVDPRDAALDDYMQNVDDFGLRDELVTSASFARRELDLDGGSHNDWKPEESGYPGHSTAPGGDEWDSDMLRDLDSMSTSTDIEESVARIIRKRIRPSGAQYLVVYTGSTSDDARWLPESFLKTPADQRLLREFEASYPPSAQRPSSSGLSSISLESDQDEDGSEATDEDDEDIGEDELDDETIARVLQKQEELGLGSDEVLLYAGDAFFSGTMSASATTTSGAFSMLSKKRQYRVPRASKRADPNFPSAAAMADALEMDPYGGFDIMDTERPSLRPRKKGRRGQVAPELDDPDLNNQLQAAWETDRTKKRLKKAEREELRKQGLLGRNGKAPDLKAKYKDGVDMMEVVEDIRDFMMSDKQSLSLPPMPSHRRAVIHQLVHQIGVSSKSRGDGPNRFTVLAKTRRVNFHPAAFDKLVQRKFKNRLQGDLPNAPGQKGAQKSHPVVGYKDGDVVGATAPELGPENKGRALLEKMGWSKGMALGAHDNKGILHPIAHTVKMNKAGLR